MVSETLSIANTTHAYTDMKKVQVKIPKRFKYIDYLNVDNRIMQVFAAFIVDLIVQTKEYNSANYVFILSDIFNTGECDAIIDLYKHDQQENYEEFISVSIELPRSIVQIISAVNNQKLGNLDSKSKIGILLMFVIDDIVESLSLTYDKEGIINYLENEYYVIKSIMNSSKTSIP